MVRERGRGEGKGVGMGFGEEGRADSWGGKGEEGGLGIERRVSFPVLQQSAVALLSSLCTSLFSLLICTVYTVRKSLD